VERVGGVIVLKTDFETYANPRAFELHPSRASQNLRPLAELKTRDVPALYVSQIADGVWEQLAAVPDVNIYKQRFRGGNRPGYFADITATGVSKTSGAAWWLAYHGLLPEQVVGIGDGENDVPLF